MPPAAVCYQEMLTIEEQAFLQRREAKERKQFYSGARVIMGICFAVPFAFAWVKALDGKSNPFSPSKYFAGVAFLIGLSGIAGYISYRRTLYRLRLDLRRKQKTVEATRITRKLFMPQNGTYHLYLTSSSLLSIEVADGDYRRLDVGDEVNIEYTPAAKIYLGYY